MYMIVINILCLTLGSFLTENNKLALPILLKQLDRKPFNCRPCLTFHLLWISYATTALVLQSWLFFVIGFIFSFAIFALLYIDNQSKISK